MRKAMRLALLVPVVCTCALAAGSTELEDLLKKLDLTYSTLEDGSYRILVEDDVDATFVNAKVVDFKIKMVFLYCPVVLPPKDVVPPTNFYKKIAELNDEMIIGRLSLTPEGGVFYSSSFWMNSAESGILALELVAAHELRLNLAKKLSPLLELRPR